MKKILSSIVIVSLSSSASVSYAAPDNSNNNGQQGAGTQQQTETKQNPIATAPMNDKIAVSKSTKAAYNKNIQLMFDRMMNGNLDGVKALATGEYADNLLFADSVQYKKLNLKQKKKYGRFILDKTQALKKIPNGYYLRVRLKTQKGRGLAMYRISVVKESGIWKISKLVQEGKKSQSLEDALAKDNKKSKKKAA